MSKKQIESKKRAWKILRLRGMYHAAATLFHDELDAAEIQEAIDSELKYLKAEPEGKRCADREGSYTDNTAPRPATNFNLGRITPLRSGRKM